MTIDISVVMPVFNAEKFVREAVRSILTQSLTDLELIIVNDGSTDRTGAILDECLGDKRVQVISQANQGIVTALNRGVAAAKGRWIARMDADDVSERERLERQLEILTIDRRIVLSGTDCKVIDENGAVASVRRYPTKHEQIVKCLRERKPVFPHASVAFDRQSVVALGGYRERFRHAEDLDLWLRLTEIGRCAGLNEALLRLRKHGQNISNLDGGRRQRRAGYLARISHFRRAMGGTDPAECDDARWEEFLGIIAPKLDELLDEEAVWYTFRNGRGERVGARKALGPRVVLHKWRSLLRVVGRRLFGNRAAEALAAWTHEQGNGAVAPKA